jgi:hypothetical protein
MTCGVSNMLFDGMNTNIDQLNDGLGNDLQVRPDIAVQIREELKRTNPYIKDLDLLAPHIGTALFEGTGIPAGFHLNVRTHAFEIGVVLNQDIHQSTIYRIRTANNPDDFLTQGSEEVEPLLYPLLFPCGEKGWSQDLKVNHKMDFLDYLAARLLQPEPEMVLIFDDDRSFGVNRFKYMSRLSQYYMVEGMSRALDKQLQYQAGNQNRYGVQNDEDNPEGKRTFLSDSVQGNNYYTMQNSILKLS